MMQENLIGRSNPRWCIAYIATITCGAVIVPILPDFNANDVHHIINHSQSKLLFVGDTFWDIVETENTEGIQYQALPGVMEENLRALNSLVAPYEKVSQVILYPNEFEKTPKKSIKRYLYNV